MIFTNVVKPTHLCNLACTYCYNDDLREPIMKDGTLARMIAETFSYVRDEAPQRLINFIWHGGEPMIPGLKFYRRVAELQAAAQSDVTYTNSIQTNGTLITEDWISFFVEHEYRISISIDGTKPLHDTYRVDKGGKGSFDSVLDGIMKVKKAGLDLGVCIVISSANQRHAAEVYDFVAALGVPFNVIPLNRSGAARENYLDLGLAPEAYAKPWIKMYDRWWDDQNHDHVYCSDFVYKTRAIMAGRPADCVGLSQCSNTNISVDPLGDVYPCATLSASDDCLYGNINNQSLHELMSSSAAQRFRNREIDPECAKCKWQHVCHGGCLARSHKFFGNHNKRDYFCPSLYEIYEHINLRLAEKTGNDFSVLSYQRNNNIGKEVNYDRAIQQS